MTERRTVQEPMIRYAEQIGWQRLSTQEALRQRHGESGRFLSDPRATVARAQSRRARRGARRGGDAPVEPAQDDDRGQSRGVEVAARRTIGLRARSKPRAQRAPDRL